jgi:hypothetical protein
MNPMIIAAGFQAVQGLMGASAANRKASADAQRGYENERLGWEENTAQNKAIGEANLQTVIRTGYKTGLLNLQMSQAKKLAIQNGTALSASRDKIMGAATASAAAAGSVGSSVDAVLSDIEQQAFEAKSNQDADYDVQKLNFDTQLHDILMTGQDTLKSAATANIQRGQDAEQIGIGEVLLGTAIKMGSEYYGAKMKLGLGEKKTT